MKSTLLKIERAGVCLYQKSPKLRHLEAWLVLCFYNKIQDIVYSNKILSFQTQMKSMQSFELGLIKPNIRTCMKFIKILNKWFQKLLFEVKCIHYTKRIKILALIIEVYCAQTIISRHTFFGYILSTTTIFL